MGEKPSPDRRGPKGKHIDSANELGRVIQEARLAKGWTTPELAEKVGVTDASVTQTEAGQTIPRKPTIKEYEKHLEVDLMTLRDREVAKRKAANGPHLLSLSSVNAVSKSAQASTGSSKKAGPKTGKGGKG